ncbi:MAG: M48 family metallopeptidase [Halarcobacter sp.]
MIKGFLYEKYSSSSIEVLLEVDDSSYLIKNGKEIITSGSISNLVISSRLGNVQRKITLEDGRLFSTEENDLVDDLLLDKNSLLHKLESNLLLIFFSLIFSIAIGYSFIVYGIPYSSKKIAFALPVDLNKSISNTLLKTLDENFLHQSFLDEAKKNKIKDLFEKKVLKNINNEENFDYKIHFRNIIISNKSIANAFALPNGDIILSDAFIKLAKNEEEIEAVIYHEIGHIKNRHTLQSIIQRSFVAFIGMYLTGDVSMSSDLILGFGTLFINTSYSREHEQESDIYALNKMLQIGINPKYLADILSKLSKNDKKEKKPFLDLFSTHPTTKQRVKLINKYTYCYNKKIYPCK